MPLFERWNLSVGRLPRFECDPRMEGSNGQGEIADCEVYATQTTGRTGAEVFQCRSGVGLRGARYASINVSSNFG